MMSPCKVKIPDASQNNVEVIADTVGVGDDAGMFIRTDEVPFDIVMLKAEPDDFAYATGIYTVDVCNGIKGMV